ncbi:MAG: hypothetical protein KDC98_12545 [Planctomycetes bacterium]|nr:hypothetical protein [Planctomycetota bacterium]
MQRLLLSVLLSSTALLAQDGRMYFHGSIGLAGGNFSFENDDRSLDDDTDAGMFLVEFEAASRRGFGGGIRFESVASDDDLFVRNGAPANEARMGTLFAHFTYLVQEHRFMMPIRVGVLVNSLTFEENVTGLEVQYGSVGPYFEVEPELTIVRRGPFRWTLFGQFGVGVGGTAIEVDNDFRDYDSATAFVGVEFGTRLRVGPGEFGIGYVGRFQSMDESDVEAGQVVLAHDAAFSGLLVTFGVTF